MNVSDVEVTAGLGGFLVLFGLALVVWFLGRDLSRRLRRMRQSEAGRAQAHAEKPGPPQPHGPPAPGQQPPASTDPPVTPPHS